MAEDVGGIVWTADINTARLTDAERRINKSTRNADRSFRQAGKGADTFNREIDKTSGSAKGAALQVKRLATAVASAMAVRQVVSYAEAWTNVQNQLRVVTDSQEDLESVSSRLIGITKETRASLEGTAKLYSRFRRGVDDTVISDERLLGVTRTINQALAVSGATAQESEGALRQLAQGMASGALRGEEFNSVSEQAPGILRAVSQETGMAVGELREFAATGGITSELLIKSLENYAETADREFSSSTRTMSQSLEVARTNAVEFVGATNLITGSVDLAGDAVVFLSENLDSLVAAATAGAAIFGARFVKSLGVATMGFVASTRESMRYQASLASMAGVSRTAAASQIALSRAVSAARGGLALLGGPAGVIFLAASALTYYATTADDASDKSERLSAEVDGLVSSFENMDRSATIRQLRDFEQQADAARDRVADIAAEIDQLQDQVILQRQMGNQDASIRALNQIAELQEEAQELNDDMKVASETAFELQKRLYGIAEGGDPFEVPANGARDLAEDAREAGAAVRNVAADIAWAQEKVRAGLSGGDDPFATPDNSGGGGKAKNEPDPGDLGLTRLQQLESQYEQERQMLLDAQQAGIDSKVSYESRLTELQRQYSEQRQELMRGEATGMIAALDSVGFSFEQMANRGVGAAVQVAAGMQDGEQAAKSFAMTLVTDMLGALVRLGLQAVTSTLMASGAEQTAKATSVATTGAAMAATTATTAAAAAAAAAAWTAPATLASIATLGGAAGVGTAAVGTALAAGQAMTAASQATNSLASAAGSAIGGGRLYGGQVNPGTMYPVSEDGKPELLTANGKQYLLPGTRGDVTSNREMTQQGGGNITVQQTINAEQSMDAQRFRNMVYDSNVRGAIVDVVERHQAKRGRRL